MITFISTYPPIMCGIGSYTKYLLKHMPDAKVISFDLANQSCYGSKKEDNVEYTIDQDNIKQSIDTIFRTTKELLWFQHSFGIWQDKPFIETIKKLKNKKIATFHTIHFQSKQTTHGLTRREQAVLKSTLPYLDAATFFTEGACNAVSLTFPEHKDKIVLIRHGTHLYKKITRKAAKQRLFAYLTQEADIPEEDKQGLLDLEPVFFKSKTKILGNVGFITPCKAENFNFITGIAIQNMMPNSQIITIRIGVVRNPRNQEEVEEIKKLKRWRDHKKSFVFDCYLPEEIFHTILKAFNILLFWPDDCTQSGRLAHAQGAGASVVGRDMEGLGETLKQSNYFTAKSYDDFLSKVREVLLSKDIRMGFERSAKAYASEFHFKVQAKKHMLLAKTVLNGEKNLPSMPLSD